MRAIGEAEPPPGFVNPTENRLAGMIHDYAPNVANTPIADDDPIARFADEMIRAALRYAYADPRTVHGSAGGVSWPAFPRGRPCGVRPVATTLRTRSQAVRLA